MARSHSTCGPLYARLRADRTFALLAPSHQFNALVTAAEEESPSKAAVLRQYEATAQAMLLGWLNDVLRENPNPKREVELWKVWEGERERTCIAVYLSNGIDVRLVEGDGFRGTRLVGDARECATVADEWKSKLLTVGWCQTTQDDERRRCQE